MLTIKVKKEMNEREFIKYLVDHENTNIYSIGLSRDGAWISIEPEIESKVGSQLKEVSKDGKIFTVEIEEPITEDTVIPKIAELNLCGYDQHEELFVNENKSIKQLLSEEETNNVAFYIMNNDLTMTLIWTKEKGLVE